MFCNKCGSQIPEGCDFCTACGAPKVKQEAAVPQQAYTQAYASAPQHDMFGNFGGLIISGALAVLLLIIGALASDMFLSGANLNNIFRQILVMLPIGFAAALTIRTKGLDLSVPAMVSLSAMIVANSDSLGVGILLALILCVVIGSINAAAIHFLKLPAILVTLAMMLIVSFAASRMAASVQPRQIEIAPAWTLIAALLAAAVAVALALLTSSGRESRFASNVLPVYAGSGVLAVLYVIALMARLRMANYMAMPVNQLIFIGVFLAVARFHRNKSLGVVFSIVPVLLYGLLNNALCIFGVNAYIQSIIVFVIIAVMIGVIGCRGRAALAGHNLDAGGKKKVWIAIVPLLVYLLLPFICMAVLAATNGQTPLVFYQLTGTISQVIQLLVAIGFAVWYSLADGLQPVGYQNGGGPAQ